MTKHTINRRSDVVTRVEGDETLVLDPQSNTAHCLSGSVASVWNSTEASVAKVAADTGLTVDAVEAAAATLADLDLVEATAGLSRRTLVTRGAMLGGAVVAAGAISMPLPASAAAASSGSWTVSGSCAGNHATFTIAPTGSKGVLASNHTYNATLVYESWDAVNQVLTYWTVTFDVQTNGAKVFSATLTSGGTDNAPGTSVSAVPGGSGGSGTITVTTSNSFASSSLTLPGDLWTAPPPTAHGFGPVNLLGSGAGNVYLQFKPTVAGDPSWAGYFGLTGCITVSGQPNTAWPPPTT